MMPRKHRGCRDAHGREGLLDLNGAFTLIELLVVIAIIAILAAILIPVLDKAKVKAQRATCLGHLEQINHAIQLYATENADFLPMITNTTSNYHGTGDGTNLFIFFYKPLVMNYCSLQGAPSPHDRLFACPADKFYYVNGNATDPCISESLHDQLDSYYSSYGYNGFGQNPDDMPYLPDDLASSPLPGLFGRKLAAITDPSKTVLVAEESAFWPFAWHDSARPAEGDFGFNNAKSEVSFTDGHASYIPIYSYTNLSFPTCFYNPPAGYDYKWSAN